MRNVFGSAWVNFGNGGGFNNFNNFNNFNHFNNLPPVGSGFFGGNGAARHGGLQQDAFGNRRWGSSSEPWQNHHAANFPGGWNPGFFPGGNQFNVNLQSNNIVRDVGGLLQGIGGVVGGAFNGIKNIFTGDDNGPQGQPNYGYMEGIGPHPAPQPVAQPGYNNGYREANGGMAQQNDESAAALPPGDARARMQAAQAMLAQLGFQTQSTAREKQIRADDKITAQEMDGIDGKLTSAAFKEFQRDHKLKVTGDLDAATFQALQADVSAHQAPQADLPKAKAHRNFGPHGH